MNKNTLICLLMLLGLCGPATGADPIGSYRLNDVRFEGVAFLMKNSLAKTLANQARPMWKFWLEKPVLTENDLKDDVLRILQFYKNHGYYHTRATYKTSRLDSDREDPSAGSDTEKPPPLLQVTFTVDAGPPVVVRSTRLDVEPESPEIKPEELLKALPLSSGTVFEIGKYREAKRILTRLMGNEGYPFAGVSGKVRVNTVTNTADLSYRVEPGKAYRFGPVTILKEDTPVQDVVVLRAITFKPGERYSRDAVEKSQRNLYSLDIFKLSLITPQEPQPDTDAVPMQIQLKAKKRHNLKFGIGYGNEDKLRLKGAWTYRNLWGWAGNFSLNAKRSDLVEGIHGDYTQPLFLDAKNTLRAKSGFEREKLVSYTNRKAYGNASLLRKFRKNWHWIGGYNLEFNNLEDIKVSDPNEIQDLTRENIYLISSLQGGLVYDTTNRVIDPRSGSTVSLGVEWASRYLGSELDYLQPAIELKRYQPLFDNLTLAGRLQVVTIESDEPDKIPIFKRLFLGGSNTVRGYDFQKLPPLDENGKPLGGLSALNANIEIRFPIYRGLTGVTFSDMGLLDNETLRYNFGDMRYSCGIGLRYKTIVGPLRIDWGYQLNPPEESGNADRWRIHFSIGHAF